MIGIGLGDAGGDGADADLGNQLHRDQGLGIDVLQIVDELLQILDRIDVVMRRRRDETDAGRRMPHLGDRLVDLVARELAALAATATVAMLAATLIRTRARFAS